MTVYADYYKAKHEGALVFQDFTVHQVWKLMGIHLIVYGSAQWQIDKGEGPVAEIKHDEIFKSSRKLWIEVREKAHPRSGPYAEPQGIYRQDESWLWAQGDYDQLFIFSKLDLRALHQAGAYSVIENKTKTSEGFLIPEKDAIKLAMKVLFPKQGKVMSNIVGDLSALGRALHELALRDPRQLKLF